MSPRTGRPKVENPKSARFSIRLDKCLEDRLKQYCDLHNTSKGEVIRKALILFLDAE